VRRLDLAAFEDAAAVAAIGRAASEALRGRIGKQ